LSSAILIKASFNQFIPKEINTTTNLPSQPIQPAKIKTGQEEKGRRKPPFSMLEAANREGNSSPTRSRQS
jgi:hypothetical protein